MFDLTNKTALVTGASGGLGAAIARALDQQGARIVLSGTRVPALKEVASTLKNQPVICAADLSNAEEADALIGRAEAEAGAPLDILINNAGLTRDGLMMVMKDEAWRQVFTVDLESPFRLCRAAVKSMIRRRTGRIINIASIVGLSGNGGQANYAAAKAGMIGMTKSLAQEIATRGVTVNVVAPGFIETAMTQALPDNQRTNLLKAIPIGRMGQPDDVASACVYLASDEASWVTGMTLSVNGGMLMP
ncbi:3-oxoacyl-[acyl-carrier-protein] reductase [Acetobacteraceae bacterium EV16G]|uniref:3-oxoacyl-[acyl-carrier-protein] reductase n=1 Tax=Sorlinia euscelidii TaxID=3081148 RepID=A0ABU7U4U1_9PROT